MAEISPQGSLRATLPSGTRLQHSLTRTGAKDGKSRHLRVIVAQKPMTRAAAYYEVFRRHRQGHEKGLKTQDLKAQSTSQVHSSRLRFLTKVGRMVQCNTLRTGKRARGTSLGLMMRSSASGSSLPGGEEQRFSDGWWKQLYLACSASSSSPMTK